jgi:hypothetical protein
MGQIGAVFVLYRFVERIELSMLRKYTTYDSDHYVNQLGGRILN